MYSCNKKELVIRGDISSNHCSRSSHIGDIKFDIIFKNVYAYKMIELDSWMMNSDFNFLDSSVFFEIQNSDFIGQLEDKITDSHKHFVLQTYDDVFEIISDEYDLMLID